MTTAPPPPPSDDQEPPGLSDDVWEKFAEDSFGRIRADAPKEPSARARMVTARLRQEETDAAGRAPRRRRFGRRGGGRRGPDRPEVWRAGPARSDTRRIRGPRRDLIRTLLIVAVVAVAALVALNPSGALSLVRGHGHASGSTPLPPETASPTAAPTSADPGVPSVSRPFAGSPALRWADGADGIVVPPAAPVGEVTERQVADALRTTKAYLVATNLDPAELRGGHPDTALRLVDPANGEPDEMRATLRSPGTKGDPTSWLTRFRPSEAELVGDVIKVRGRMTFARAAGGAVRVHSDYDYVYPFTETGDRGGKVARVIVRRVVDTEWYPGAARGQVRIVALNSYFAGAGCDLSDGYMHPFTAKASSASPSAGPTSARPGDPWHAIDPYDRSKPLSTDAKGCGFVTRT